MTLTTSMSLPAEAIGIGRRDTHWCFRAQVGLPSFRCASNGSRRLEIRAGIAPAQHLSEPRLPATQTFA